MTRVIKPFALVSGDMPDRRNAEQLRSYDRIVEKRWRWRVAANECRRRAAKREIQPLLPALLRRQAS